MSKKLAAAVAATALVLALAPAAHAGRTVPVGPLNGQVAADATFAEGTLGADGSPAYPDPAILDNLSGLIRRADAGSYITGAIFGIDDNGSIESALRAAAAKGVDLWLVLDDGDHPPLTNFSDWNATEKAHLHWKACTYGCLSATPADADFHASIQHMKYFTFSRTQRYPDGAFTSAAWVGSANSDTNTGLNAWNNAVSIFNDSGLNAGLETVFRDQWKGADGTWGDYFDYYWWPQPNPANTEGRGAFVAATSGTVGIFSPENTAPPGQLVDLWKAQLDLLKAPGEGGASDCRIVVMQNHLDTARLAVAERLRDLSKYHCQIRIAVNYVDKPGTADDYAMIGQKVERMLCDQPGDLRILGVRKMHSKAIAAYGTFNGSYRATVWTGSHNVSGPALSRNDEIIFRLDNAPKLADEFFKEYSLAYFNTAKDICTAP